jgi:hypothetical protein
MPDKKTWRLRGWHSGADEIQVVHISSDCF